VSEASQVRETCLHEECHEYLLLPSLAIATSHTYLLALNWST
jgi:hypothetical protein